MPATAQKQRPAPRTVERACGVLNVNELAEHKIGLIGGYGALLRGHGGTFAATALLDARQ